MSDTTVRGSAAPPPIDYPFNSARSLAVSERYDQLRGSPTLPRVRLPFGEPAWLVIDYEQGRSVLGDSRFSRAAANGRDIPRQSNSPNDAGLLAMDAPDHTRLRSLISKAFTTRRIEGLRPEVRRLADDLVAGMRLAGPPVDIVERYALPFSLGIICRLLGVPERDQGAFRTWSDAHLSTSVLSGAALASRTRELHAYMAKLVAERRASPGDDLLTDLIAARDDEDRLSEQELISLLVTLLFAGYEATATLIPNFVYFLLDRPDLWDELRSEPDRIPGTVEELLRFVPLMAGAGTMPRYARTDVTIGDTTVAEGDAVIVSLGACNRDPKRFADPGSFSIGRGAGNHLAFGHGPHHCVGRSLARVELQESLAAVLRTFPRLRVYGEIRWKKQVMRGPRTMMVTW